MVTNDDIAAGCVLLISSSTALLTNLATMGALYGAYRTTKRPFYLLLFALSVSNSVTLSLFVFYSSTATFTQKSPLGPAFDSLFCGTLCNATYFSSLALLVNIALNRYFAVCKKDILLKVYDRRSVTASIGLCYAFGFVSAIAQMTPCCSLRYDQSEYGWNYDETLRGNALFLWYDRFLNLVTCVSLVVAYWLICERVRKWRLAAELGEPGWCQNQKPDIHLAVQMALISCVVIVLGLGFTIIPLATSGKWWRLLSSVLYIASAGGVHPFVYIAFNRLIRQRVFGLFPCRRVDDGRARGNLAALRQVPPAPSAPPDHTDHTQK